MTPPLHGGGRRFESGWAHEMGDASFGSFPISSGFSAVVFEFFLEINYIFWFYIIYFLQLIGNFLQILL